MDRTLPVLVIDTNALVASAWPGASRRLVAAWRDGALRLVVSPAILQEYDAILSRFTPSQEHACQVLDAVHTSSHRVVLDDVPAVTPVPADHSDAKWLAAAVAAHADALVSADAHLLCLWDRSPVWIAPPREVWRWFHATQAVAAVQVSHG